MKLSILESLSGLQKNWFVIFVTNIRNLNQKEICGVLVLVAKRFEALVCGRSIARIMA
jgi:hypothetical protein